MSTDVTTEPTAADRAKAEVLMKEVYRSPLTGDPAVRDSIAAALAAERASILALPAVRNALAAQEAVTAVRELHTRDSTEPYACEYCGQAWPCDVIHALDTAGDS